jgi:hypothetical protein
MNDNTYVERQIIVDLADHEWDRLFPEGTRTPTQMKLRARQVIRTGLSNLHRFPVAKDIAPLDVTLEQTSDDDALWLTLNVSGDSRVELESEAFDLARAFFEHDSFRLIQWEVTPVVVPAGGTKLAEMLGMAPLKKYKGSVIAEEHLEAD